MNYITLYLVDLKAKQWAEVGVYYSIGSVEMGFDVDLPFHPLFDQGMDVVHMDDRRDRCRFRRGEKWVDPICADFDKFVSIIDNQKQMEV